MSLNVRIWIGRFVAAFAIALCALSPGVFAQGNAGKGSITGFVLDSTGAAVPGAQVKVSPLNETVTSKSDGSYTVGNVPDGTYTLTISYVGFSPATETATVTGSQPLKLDLKLATASGSEQILVTAERPHGEAMAINKTRTADNIVQVVPAEVITSLPNANVADAIGRLPSVTLYRIEGEGVYIQVRGLEPRLTNVTVDGITLPAPEPTVRQVRLDVIPSDLVEALELNKTLSASQDGNGIAGSVNLRTKEAGEVPTINAYGIGGYTPILDGRSVYSMGVTLGQRFGVNKKLGVLFNTELDHNNRGIDNIQPALDPQSTFAQPFYDNNTIREYRYYRKRYGYSGSVDYRFNDQNSIYAHGFYSDLQDFGDKWYYEPISTAISTTTGLDPSPTATSSSAPKFYTSNKRPNASVGTIILGGRDVHSNSLLTYQVSSSRAYEQDSAGNPKADFTWNAAKLACNYAPQGVTMTPHFNQCDTGSNSPLFVPANWTFADITISKGLNAELDLTAQTSYSRNYNFHGHFGSWEAGFKFSNAHQSQDSTETVYDSFTNAPTMANLLDSFQNDNYYHWSYFGGTYGPVSNFVQTQAYTLANFSGNVDAQKTVADIYPNLFHTVERITAGYAMNTIDFGKLHLQTGLRFENTNTLTFGYNLTFEPGTDKTPCATGQTTNCYIFTGVNNNPSYLDVLPSVQARYTLTNNSAIRAVVARGVARPDPYQLVPYVTANDSASPPTVAIGNPSIRPEHATNYDVMYEDYLKPLGLFQAGFFFKQLNAPQVESILPSSVNPALLPAGYFSPSLLSTLQNYPGYTITQYINGENAYLYGFEISFQQHFTYLPSVLGGLGLSANYSYINSREKGLPLRSDSPTLIDQTPTTFKISPTYDNKRVSIRLGLAYDGHSRFSYGYVSPAFLPTPATGTLSTDPNNLGPNGPTGDVYTLTHYQIDAQGSFKIHSGLSAVVSALNINDEVFGYYTGSTNFVNQREFYKPTYSAGLKYNFQRESK
jgi:TonB-dependent receptor